MTELEAFCRSHNCEIPIARSGDWRIVRYLGYWTGLVKGDQVWMTDTPDEIADHEEPYRQAKARGGRCLVNGLGLGLIVRAFLSLRNVEHVDVVEISGDVINLVAPYLPQDRLTIYHADAERKKWPERARWSVAWHDIWAEGQVGWSDMYFRFMDRCDWQGAWGKALVRSQLSR